MSDLTRSEAEYVEVKAERDQLRTALDQANLTIQELHASRQEFIGRNRRLRHTLEAIEWAPAGPIPVHSCPSCLAQESAGHKPGCNISGVLGELRGQATLAPSFELTRSKAKRPNMKPT